MGERGIAPLILKLRITWKWEVSFIFWPLCPQEISLNLKNHWIGKSQCWHSTVIYIYIYIYIYILTYSMVQSPSSEANWFAASQETPHISWNPKVHFRTHKLPPPVSIMGQPNPVHIPTSHLLEIHPNTYIYKHKTEIKYRRIKPRFHTDIDVHVALTDILV